MNKAKAWFIASRPFAIPWILVNTFLGARLAGFDFGKWLLASAIVSLILLAAHYVNNWRDFVKGFDKLESGSSAKPYTAASQLLPRGELTVQEMKGATIIVLGLSLVLMGFAPKRLDVWLLYILGVSVALTYTDFFKPKGFGEVALFLGHGFGASTFAYSLIRPVTVEALAAGTLLGMLAGIVYTIDQWQDVETDFAKRVKNYAYLIAKAEMRLSTFFYFAVTAIVTIHLAFVLMGVLRPSTLKALLLMPLFHFAGVMLECQFEKGVWLSLIAIWLYPILMAL